MTEWKLTHLENGKKVYTFKEGDKVTIGRAPTNTIPISSIVISRKHCVIHFKSGKIFITDTKSSNGVYVGTIKIPQDTPYEIKNRDIIGIGSTDGLNREKLPEEPLFIFKLTRVNTPPLIGSLKYQSENEIDEIEDKIAALDSSKTSPVSPVRNSVRSLKRKVVNDNEIKKEIKKEKKCRIVTIDDDVVDLLSDSDQDNSAHEVNQLLENVKLEANNEENHNNLHSDQTKSENEYLKYEALDVKQEYMGYDDGPINLDSDSDIESEQWFLRLSQNSPGKPFTKITKKKSEETKNDSSYSQLDENVIDLCFTENDNEEDDFMEDIITIPPLSPPLEQTAAAESPIQLGDVSDLEQEHDIISLQGSMPPKPTDTIPPSTDEIDGAIEPANHIPIASIQSPKITLANKVKKTQMIEAQHQSHRSKSKHKSESNIKRSKIEKHSSKKLTSSSQKEERKKKLKEIAEKTKEIDKDELNASTSSSTKIATNVKITSTNRGAFLTSTIEIIKPSKKKDKPKADKAKEKTVEVTSPDNQKGSISPADSESNKSQSSNSDSSMKDDHKTSGRKEHKSEKSKRKSSNRKSQEEPTGSISPADSESNKSQSSNSDSSMKDDHKSSGRKEHKSETSKSRSSHRTSQEEPTGSISPADSESNKSQSFNSDSSMKNDHKTSGRKEHKSETSKRRSSYRTSQEEPTGSISPADSVSNKSQSSNSDSSMKDDHKTSGRKEHESETSKRRSSHRASQEEPTGSISPADSDSNKSQSSNSDSSMKDDHKSSRRIEHKSETSNRRSSHRTSQEEPTIAPVTQEPLNNLNSSEAQKKVKTVRFSDTPVVVEFQIEPGNTMKKTNSTVQLSSSQPKFSLDKLALINILRWNPPWFEEQLILNDPPPVLGIGHGPPPSMLHNFTSHSQYVDIVGKMLLIEIWECLTLAYNKIRGQNNFLEMRIEHLPPMPSSERCYDLFSFSVNISIPTQESKKVPRAGEILIITFGPQKLQRFFYVHNVRCLPSPPNNIHSFYSIGLHSKFSEKLRPLRLGEAIYAQPLAFINNELYLFEAMEYLSSSPLKEIILAPKPEHFVPKSVPLSCLPTKWKKTLNPSQQAAVAASVGAALGDKPCIQMVQGPPGTGKSTVICTMVMSYFYNEEGQKHPHRGKVLICATSNAAVDELVIRLLKIRQELPRDERFRMVRVGRTEAMVFRARDLSSQHLAQRAVKPHASEPAHHAEEIALLEAKINMWKSCATNAKDPVRAAYCEGRAKDLQRRIALVMKTGGGGGGGELRPDQLLAAERRIIEGADIIVTTLSSAYSHKMKGLNRRIALCIIDEAGQAIEPETLLPLTLNISKLTLIGDPQQLPGYICSQRAKKLGLGDSLFSRLTSVSELWEVNPVILLNQQYRMQAVIADYPNRAFYGGVVVTSAAERPALSIPPYTILTISSGDRGQGPCGGNEMEAWGVARLVHALKPELSSLSLSLAVITPYHAHKDLIKKNLKILMGTSECPVEVNTVDSFQGQERDVVVVSLARSHGVGFLTDTGRMNVMLTRAKHALIVCLNPHAMLKNNLWRTLLEDAQVRKTWRILPHHMCLPVAPGHEPRGDILQYVKPISK